MCFTKIKTTFFLVVCLLKAPVGTAQNSDINLLYKINYDRNIALDGSFRIITKSVLPISIVTPGILFGIGLIQHDSLPKQNALYIAASLLSSGIITTVLKYSVNRKRPFVTYTFIKNVAEGGASTPSFPSGHTSDAFALATSLTMAYQKWYVIAPAYLWAATVGYSRMHLGVHYPSDVLAGIVIGSGSAYLCYKGRRWLNKKTKFIQ